MKIVFLSGKGGTGKTTVSTNIAFLNGYNYIDCDVEEPNGHIFLKPKFNKVIDSGILNPVIDEEKCTLCNTCVENCQFGSLANTGKEILVFNELCHGCGTCSISCQFQAITEAKRNIGKIEMGSYTKGTFIRAVLNVKEPIAVPLIKELKNLIDTKGINILDAPPGSSCTVVETLEDADYAVIVTEPSAFGLSDLKQVVSIARNLKIPFGVIINRGDENNPIVTDYLSKEAIHLIGVLPYSMKAARIYSKGDLLLEDNELRKNFENLNEEIMKRVTVIGKN